uniref:Uncharacterized protein n=1 Tax=Glossina austeni TaxID=7395 RepID=A0A1A9VUR6_GLOAU
MLTNIEDKHKQKQKHHQRPLQASACPVVYHSPSSIKVFIVCCKRLMSPEQCRARFGTVDYTQHLTTKSEDKQQTNSY